MYSVDSKIDYWLNDCIELVKTVGFCLIENVFTDDECKDGISALENIKFDINNDIGIDRLQRAGEEGVFRAPMKYEDYFYKLLENLAVQSIASSTVSDTSILHLQNGFIFPAHDPDQELNNFQYTFHPDFPRFLNRYIASVNILVTFVDIDPNDEVFYIVPGSQQHEVGFSQDFCSRNNLSIGAKAGSALVFDSTTWHCGGPNYSGNNWYGVNHQFTRSYFKQQLDYVRVLGDEKVIEQKDRVQQMLGFYSRVVTSLDEYYQPSEKRLYRSGQG